MAVLDENDVAKALAGLPGWDREGGEIVRVVRLANFRDAVAFVVRVGFEAEAANHHPDLDIRWNKVRVALSTHDEGGITGRDLDLARAIQSLAPPA